MQRRITERGLKAEVKGRMMKSIGNLSRKEERVFVRRNRREDVIIEHTKADENKG